MNVHVCGYWIHGVSQQDVWHSFSAFTVHHLVNSNWMWNSKDISYQLMEGEEIFRSSCHHPELMKMIRLFNSFACLRQILLIHY